MQLAHLICIGRCRPLAHLLAMAKRRKLSSGAAAQEGAPSTISESKSKPSRYAITFGEVAVLHIGGAEVGNGRREEGFTVAELRELSTKLPGAELVMVSDVLPKRERREHEAAVLLLRGGVATLLDNPDAAEMFWQEQCTVSYDRQFFDRGRTKNKLARYNVVFGDEEQTASKDFRQCTIRAFKNLPWLGRLRQALPAKLGSKAIGLNAEGNHYYDGKCGIGFHGDAERKIVICLSLGATSTLRYQWRQPQSSEPFGAPVDIDVQHGDVYVMSEKATGFDWKSRSKLRVVHAAGAAKYIS